MTALRWLLAGPLLGLTACAGAPAAPPNRTARPSVKPADGVAWRYDVSFVAGKDLLVDARFDATEDVLFSSVEAATPFVHDVEVARASAWEKLERQGPAWRAACSAGCRLRYRFALSDATRGIDDAETAIASGAVFVAPPSTWLLRPKNAPSGRQLELHVTTEPTAKFVTGFHPVSGAPPGTYGAATSDLRSASFAAFGALQVAEVPAGDTTVQLAVAPERLGMSFAHAQAWVAASAGAVASYYQGQLPARHTLLLLMQGSSDSTQGVTLGGGGAGVLLRAARNLTPNKTGQDWVMTHELLHANFVDVGFQHAWLSEGLATYLEPLARARVGLLGEKTVWHDMLEGLPEGLPEAGDQGLNRTRTWGRTYWGGALFCFVADVTLRERTGNRRSLDDVLLAIGKAGVSDEDHWSMQQVLAVAESSTGTPVLRELYEQLAEKPGSVALSNLFARLGVRSAGGSVVFDDAAPLAKIRQSLTARRPG